ncbi:unnamed protein product, partial [Polarella glacialis]
RQAPADQVVTPEALLRWIVCSLYMDEAIPTGVLLQWYYQLVTGVKLSHGQITALVESTPGMYLDPPAPKKQLSFRAVLEEPPPSFQGFVQDSMSTEEVVSTAAWAEARDLLSKGGWPLTDDTLYKYITVAAWLQNRSPVLASVSFGRLLRMVNICCHQHTILGVCDGLIVPYSQSEEYERLANAEAGQPTGVKSNEAYIRNWAELKDCLMQLIRLSPTEEVEVSQVKLQCRSRLHKELSETVFGHTTLSKLLDDPNFGPEFKINCHHSGRQRIALNIYKDLTSKIEHREQK